MPLFIKSAKNAPFYKISKKNSPFYHLSKQITKLLQSVINNALWSCQTLLHKMFWVNSHLVVVWLDSTTYSNSMQCCTGRDPATFRLGFEQILSYFFWAFYFRAHFFSFSYSFLEFFLSFAFCSYFLLFLVLMAACYFQF